MKSLEDLKAIREHYIRHQKEVVTRRTKFDLEAARRREMAETESTALPAAQAELFAGLLESAYALDTAEGREMAEAIRFHLHAAGVEVVDYEKGREAWFEFLPARRKGTIRPALASGQKLVRKGLASA